MVLRFFAAAIVGFLLTFAGHYYLYMRLIEPLVDGEHGWWPTLLAAAWFITFFGFALSRAVPAFLRKYVELLMFVWMGCAYLFLLLCIISSPFSLAISMNQISQKPLAIFVIALGFLFAVYAVTNVMRKEKIVEVSIQVKEGISSEIEDIKIIVLSDIHVAGLVGKKRMKRLVETVSALQPDIIFITGDLVDGTVRQLKNDVAPLGNLKAPLGIFYVTGNHEYYCNAAKWKKHIADNFKWNVLENKNTSVYLKNGTHIRMIGIEDRSWLSANRKTLQGTDPRLQLATEGISAENAENTLNILLAHQPKDTRLLKNYPWIDLQISGHTHGGQLWPLQLFVYSDQKYNRGLYKLENNAQLYVTQGTGFWGPPMRLGTQCEISLIRFKRKIS
jgi:uncharacterized protein